MDPVGNDGRALQYASPELQDDIEVVMNAVRNDGRALQFASPSLQRDKSVVLTAINEEPDAIKHLPHYLKRDRDVLIASGMFDEDHGLRKQQLTKKIVLSTRFSLNALSDSEANNFTALIKKSKYIQEGSFKIYAPNAFDLMSCDIEWTNFDWPCRGTNDTCQYNNVLADDGRPSDYCCWRYYWRFRLQDAKDTGGFMLQLVETEPTIEHGKVKDATLGNGQKIELDMAHSVGVKVFQVYRPSIGDYGYEEVFENCHIDRVLEAIKNWYDGHCMDMSVSVIRPRVAIDEQHWLTALQSCGHTLKDAPILIRDDKRMVKVAVQQDGLALHYATTHVCNDKDVVKIAIGQNPAAFKFATPELRNEIGFVLPLIKANPDFIKYVQGPVQLIDMYWLLLV